MQHAAAVVAVALAEVADLAVSAINQNQQLGLAPVLVEHRCRIHPDNTGIQHSLSPACLHKPRESWGIDARGRRRIGHDSRTANGCQVTASARAALDRPDAAARPCWWDLSAILRLSHQQVKNSS